jgi:hypothetical protein
MHYVVLALFMAIWIGFIFYQNFQTIKPTDNGGKDNGSL